MFAKIPADLRELAYTRVESGEPQVCVQWNSNRDQTWSALKHVKIKDDKSVFWRKNNKPTGILVQKPVYDTTGDHDNSMEDDGQETVDRREDTGSVDPRCSTRSVRLEAATSLVRGVRSVHYQLSTTAMGVGHESYASDPGSSLTREEATATRTLERSEEIAAFPAEEADGRTGLTQAMDELRVGEGTQWDRDRLPQDLSNSSTTQCAPSTGLTQRIADINLDEKIKITSDH